MQKIYHFFYQHLSLSSFLLPITTIIHNLELHLAQGTLKLLKRTFLPTANVIHTLISRNPEPLISQIGNINNTNNNTNMGSQLSIVEETAKETAKETTKEIKKINSASLLTPLTRMYLGDVLDHANTVVETMTGVEGQAKDLVDLVSELFFVSFFSFFLRFFCLKS